MWLDLPDDLDDWLQDAGDDPREAGYSFFLWYEVEWLHNDDLWATLDEMPRPFRELAVVHQAWGLAGSDGFRSFFRRFDRRFDGEVERGLEFLGKQECFRAITEGRELFERSNGTLSIDDEARYMQIFYGPLGDLEERIGRILLDARRGD